MQSSAFRRRLGNHAVRLLPSYNFRTIFLRNVTDKHYGRASVKQMRAALERIEAAYLKAK
jgi:hypothetical protein